MGLPPTEAPTLLRVVAILPGGVAVLIAVAMEVAAMREPRVPSLRLSARRMAVIAFVALCVGVSLPYLVYGVRQM